MLVFSSSYHPRPDINDLTIVDEIVNCSSTVKDIGVVLDDSMSMVPHITVCKSAFSICATYPRLGSFLRLKLLKLCYMLL